MLIPNCFVLINQTHFVAFYFNFSLPVSYYVIKYINATASQNLSICSIIFTFPDSESKNSSSFISSSLLGLSSYFTIMFYQFKSATYIYIYYAVPKKPLHFKLYMIKKNIFQINKSISELQKWHLSWVCILT